MKINKTSRLRLWNAVGMAVALSRPRRVGRFVFAAVMIYFNIMDDRAKS
jgi:hypothetical protein